MSQKTPVERYINVSLDNPLNMKNGLEDLIKILHFDVQQGVYDDICIVLLLFCVSL